MAVVARTFSPTITGSSWGNVYLATFDAVQRRRGQGARSSDGGYSPGLTRGDAAQLIAAWLSAAGPQRFKLWDQFAGAAYAWSPSRGRLDASSARRDKPYPPQLAAELWSATLELADRLDADRVEDPRLEFSTDWADPIWLGAIRASLAPDAPRAQIAPPSPVRAARPPRAPSFPWLAILAAWVFLAPRRSRSRI